MTTPSKKPLLAAFDFDFTLVEDDSDGYIFDVLSPGLRQKMIELQGKVQWTDLVHQLLGELHQEGKTKQQIIEAIGTIPFSLAIITMFETIKAAGGDIIIVSDANTVYIDEILKAKNARQYITEIVSNPGTWGPDERLSVTRRVKPPAVHGCKGVCSLNLCKGMEMIERMEGYELVLYGGDGRNDHCPMTKLKKGDVALARTGHSLEKLVKSDVKHLEAIQACVLWWNTPEELLGHVQKVLSHK
ncbi:hypothetical protein HDU79_006511 [Rhizoclosmatium sp. JEL0117]|nr:hypothetical protein HDU79_006511 [Rhizoclosmatium sp. JEL0117]